MDKISSELMIALYKADLKRYKKLLPPGDKTNLFTAEGQAEVRKKARESMYLGIYNIIGDLLRG